MSWFVSYRGTRFVIVSSSWETKCSATDPKLPLEVAPLCVRREGQRYTAVFSYANLTRSDVIVPVGRANGVSPAPTNRGQPVVFRPGVVLFAFAVRDVPVSQDVSWTVSSGGEVATARASADLGRDCRLISVEGEVDLALEKSVRPASVMVGERVEYTISVRNVGDTTARAITVLDRQLDSRVEVLSATTASWAMLDPRTGHGEPARPLCSQGSRSGRVGDDRGRRTRARARRCSKPGHGRERPARRRCEQQRHGGSDDTRPPAGEPGRRGQRPKPPFTG